MIALSVNGKTYNLDVEDDTPLLWVLRDTIGLTGTKYGCGIAQCGACTVLVDGAPTRSCQALLGSLAGRSVITIEALAQNGKLHPVQQAFWDKHGLQCGFCTPGMIMAAADLVARNGDPTDAEIRHAIAGNICRCTGYHNIVAAVRDAARVMREGSQAPAATA